MPRAASRRTFTACWTCRGRNIRCDAGIPGCSQCKRSNIVCEGYHFNLVWVDPTTGYYAPHQRRSYHCHLTWQGFPSLLSKEVDHLISRCEDNQCRCDLHRCASPFSVFAGNKDPVNVALADEEVTAKEVDQLPLDETDSHSATSVGRRPKDSPYIVPPSHCQMSAHNSDASTPGSRVSGTIGELQSSTTTSQKEEPIEQETTLSLRRGNRDTATVLLARPTPPSMVDANHIDRVLFHHFLSHLAKRMVPVDDDCNPWKTVYPSLAMQKTRSNDAEALYHALLAQSASQLANLRGPERGAQIRARGIRHYGIALCKLRQSLADASKDYTTVLAALYTVILAEHVFQGTSAGWQGHIRGAKGFVSQYLSQQPWKQSPEAYIITQNFGLAIVISSTTDIELPSLTKDDGAGEFDDLLNNLMTMPVFGYTLGGTPHILKAIYQIRRLETDIHVRRGNDGVPELDEDMFSRVGQILQLLHIPLHDIVEAYVGHRELSGILMLPRLRTLARIHLRLFNTAVSIYLFCIVLRSPPSTVVGDIRQVLNDAASFIELHDSTVSIWPVFVAAVEAYTPELQALATRCLETFKNGGAGNRSDAKRVVHEVWNERERVALERQCDPGEVSLDWREVLRRLDVNLLLL